MDGEVFQANCGIRYSCPFSPPSLHWDISPFLKNSTLIALNKKVQGQWLYTETLHGLATYEMHNSKMRCSAQFRTFIKESQQITFNILCEWYDLPVQNTGMTEVHLLARYVTREQSYYFNCILWFPISTDKPVTVTLILEKEPVMKGGSIIMQCAANCNPQPHNYSWLRRQLGEITKIYSAHSKMTFKNITQDTSVSCIAHNDIGAGQASWLDLDVQCKESLQSHSSTVPHLTDILFICFKPTEELLFWAPSEHIFGWLLYQNHTREAGATYFIQLRFELHSWQ